MGFFEIVVRLRGLTRFAGWKGERSFATANDTPPCRVWRGVVGLWKIGRGEDGALGLGGGDATADSLRE